MNLSSFVAVVLAVVSKTPDTVRYMYLGYGAIVLILGGYTVYLCLASRKLRR